MNKFRPSAALTLALFAAGTGAAEAAAVSGSTALALAGVVALYSPTLTPDEREAAAALFVGKPVAYAKKIVITADSIVCKVSHVDITARSCELTFKGSKQTITGRRANEIFATAALAGITAEGAAGSSIESFSKLTCTLDPKAIRDKAGGGAECSFEMGN